MAKDPRYKSGEHSASDDTPEQLEQMSTLAAVGAEVRSIRREMKIEFKHFASRFDDAVDDIRSIKESMQETKTHGALNYTAIKGVTTRVEKLEKQDRGSGAAVAQPETGWVMALCKNPSTPWVAAALLALAMILASITGRGISSLIPTGKADNEGSNGPAVNVNVQSKQ